MKNGIPIFLLLILFVTPAYSGSNDCPMHAEHSGKSKDADRHAEVDRRGDEVMGFEHAKSKHHFYLKKDGGVIEARAQDPKDSETLAQIQSHMLEISQLFAKGDFSKPKTIHGMTPPGVETIKEHADRIEYKYEALEDGARVHLITSDNQALAAIHEFLRFQITDHRTGDPLE